MANTPARGSLCKRDLTLVMMVSTYQNYHNEIPNILGMPCGAIYRLRYKEKWITSSYGTKECIGQAIDNEGLVGQPALIVLQNLQSHPLKEDGTPDMSAAELTRFYPVRHAIVHRIERIGEVIYFEFSIGPIASFAEAGAVGNSLETQFNYLDREFAQNNIVANHLQDAANLDYRQHCDVAGRQYPWHNPSWLRFEAFVFFFRVGNEWDGNIRPEGTEEAKIEQTRWGKTVSELIKLAAFKDIPFTKVVKVTCGKGDFIPSVLREYKGIEYRLEDDMDYEMHFVHQSASPGPHQVRLKYYAEYFYSLIPEREVFGKYDRFHLDFRTRRTLESRNTQAIIAFSDSTPVPSLEIPLRIVSSDVTKKAAKRNRGWKVTVVCLALISGIAESFPVHAYAYVTAWASLLKMPTERLAEEFHAWGILGISISIAILALTHYFPSRTKEGSDA